MYVCMYDYIAVSTRTLTPPTTGTGPCEFCAVVRGAIQGGLPPRPGLVVPVSGVAQVPFGYG